MSVFSQTYVLNKLSMLLNTKLVFQLCFVLLQSRSTVMARALTPNFGDRYLSIVSPDFFVLFFKIDYYFFFTIFFVFVNMGQYGRKIQTTSPLKVHSRCTPQKSCILLRRVCTKVVQRIVKFCLFFFFFFVFVNMMGPYGGKSFKRYL